MEKLVKWEVFLYIYLERNFGSEVVGKKKKDLASMLSIMLVCITKLGVWFLLPKLCFSSHEAYTHIYIHIFDLNPINLNNTWLSVYIKLYICVVISQHSRMKEMQIYEWCVFSPF